MGLLKKLFIREKKDYSEIEKAFEKKKNSIVENDNPNNVEVINNIDNEKTTDKTNYTTYVAGTSYNQSNIKKIVKEIAEFDSIEKYEGFTNKEILEYYYDDIWEYPPIETLYTKLIKEPNNKFDANAVRIEISSDNDSYYKVGYIPSSDLKKLDELIKEFNVFSAVIMGGNIKTIDFDTDKDKDVVIVEKKEYCINLSFTKDNTKDRIYFK